MTVGRSSRLLALAQTEWRHLAAFKSTDRRWQMPACAALASGLPILIGAAFDHLDYGLAASLGGMVFLYTPKTQLSHRMIQLMASAFAMSACYTLGLLSHFVPYLAAPALTFIAILVTMVCRFYALGPPGSLFFILAASIGVFSSVEPLQVPRQVGLLTMGALLACGIAFLYSLYVLRLEEPQPAALPAPTFDFVIFDSVVIGLFVGASLAIAQALHMERAYWAPVSCLAVIQEASMRAVWTKQLHRIAGTGVGLILAWLFLMLPFEKWSVSAMMIVLAFVVETLVVRHYAMAVIFITPLTILLAEGSSLGHGSPAALLEARFLDTLLGALAGLVGGVCLHSPRFRAVLGAQVFRLVPSRIRR